MFLGLIYAPKPGRGIKEKRRKHRIDSVNRTRQDGYPRERLKFRDIHPVSCLFGGEKSFPGGVPAAFIFIPAVEFLLNFSSLKLGN